MARSRSDFLGSLGKLFTIFKKVAEAVLELGGSDEDITKIDSKEPLARDLAKVLLGQALAIKVRWRTIGDYTLAAAIEPAFLDRTDRILAVVRNQDRSMICVGDTVMLHSIRVPAPITRILFDPQMGAWFQVVEGAAILGTHEIYYGEFTPLEPRWLTSRKS